jgi:hypothetical protein
MGYGQKPISGNIKTLTPKEPPLKSIIYPLLKIYNEVYHKSLK